MDSHRRSDARRRRFHPTSPKVAVEKEMPNWPAFASSPEVRLRNWRSEKYFRGANDLVWVGRAANYAAKLAALPENYTYITKEVYDVMLPEVKTSADGRSMWEAVNWNTFDNRTIYQSNWWWRIDQIAL